MSEESKLHDPQVTTDLPSAEPEVTTNLPARDTNRRGETSVADESALTIDTHSPTPSFESAQTGPLDERAPKAKRPVPKVPGYEIVGTLGRGGMGVVYKARQLGLERLVALKMIIGGSAASDQAVRRFLVEAQAVARFQHPGIVQIYEVGEFETLPYFSLEFVDGGTLSEKVAKEPQLPKYAAIIVEQLARAMQYSHERGIVHRDLKPGNVLLTKAGLPKIADFGLAKAIEGDAGQTQSGQVLGSPSYMAPEQARGDADKAGPPADVYALGAILYDMLTGRPPFAGSSLLDTLEMVRTREPVSPNELVAKVPKDLETICLKCLQKDIEKRYLSAGDLADDLQRYLEDRPILARPVGKAERAIRWAKRNPVVASLGSAIAFILLATAIVTTILSVSLAAQKDAAETAKSKAEDERDQKEIARAAEEVAKKDADAKRIEAEAARIAEEAAKKDADAKRIEAEAARASTSIQSGLTVNTLRTLLLGVDDLMRTNAKLAPTRLKIIEKIQADFDKLRDHAASNPLFARTEAIALTRIGDVFFAMNRITDAKVWYANALVGYKLRLEDDIKDSDELLAALFNYANTTNKSADVSMRLGDAEEAKKLYTEALEVRKRRVTISEATKVEFKINSAKSLVATSYRLIGFADLFLGEPASAELNLKESDKRFSELPPRVAGSLAVRRERAEIQVHLGNATFRQAKSAEAEKHFLAALKEREELVRLTPKPPEIAALVKFDLVQARIAIGDFLLTGRNDPAAARKEFEAAEKLAAILVKDDPDHLGYRRLDAAIAYRFGVIATGDEAKEYFAKSLELRRQVANADPKDTQGSIELMLALGRAGETPEAVKMAEALLNQAGKDRRILFQSACGFSVAAGGAKAGQDEMMNRAITVLTDLIGTGWKDRIALETDPDLVAARKDQRFAKLIEKLTHSRP